MVTFLISSILVLVLLVIAVYFWQKPANSSPTAELQLPPPEPGSLFSDFRVNELIALPEKQVPELEQKVDRETFEQAIQAIREFQQSANRSTTAKLLHAAALSDNAKNYER